jgi:ABC-type phosphate transport system substrate-binding protein
LRRFTKLATVGALALGLVAGFVAPAGAIPAGNHVDESLNVAGSDTSYFVLGGLVPLWNSDTTVNEAAHPDTVFNTPPRLGGAFPNNFHVDADGTCGAIDYPPTNPPDGSSAGISALVADGTNGCVDMARSSRGRSGADPANIQFFAYALDALSWTYFKGTHAPTNLTQQNLIDIYTCNPATGAPYVSDWSQVGGTAGTIVKYAPQPLSGTYAFLNSKLLNGAVVDQNCDAAHKSTFEEEHDNTAITKAQKPFAINAFSFAQWQAMANGVIADRRNGGKLGSINGVKPSKKTIKTTAGHFLGTRYIYNVLKTTEPSYAATLRFAGVDASGPGFLCKSSTAIRDMIRLYGDEPLTRDVTGPGLPKSFCRLEPTPL